MTGQQAHIQDPIAATEVQIEIAPGFWGSGHPLVRALGQTWRSPRGRIGATLVVFFIFVALAAPLISPHSPSEQFRGEELLAPSSKFLLGTDQLGRDLLSRLIHGTRVSLEAGVVAVGLGAFVGITTGLFAGYNDGSIISTAIMRCYDGLLTFPSILLAIAIITALGPGLLNVAIAIGLAQAPIDARLTRSIVLSQRERDYVLATRSLGASGTRIVLSHILPNTLPLLLVQFSVSMSFAILTEGGLSFLGLGTQPPTPSWGGMLNDSRPYMRELPWYALWPGLALAMLLLGLNLLTDSLRDALDPKHIANT